ncbi:MAG: hypothetical protein JW782_05350 [Candidatus Saganbacteria bacterium]|nr:hypothetical protein [Candidatus Saganbacteria bacterium]
MACAFLLATTMVVAKDLRAVKLKKFLDRYPWSPLRGHEQEILYCADKFGLDYRLYVAIAGAESSYGKRYPLGTKNLTGYNSCKTGFTSIWENIYETSKLIGTTSYYKKFRKTGDIKDLIYVYKGVPPYQHYYENMRYALDQITAVSIEKELAEQRAVLATKSPGGKLNKQSWQKSIFTWTSVPFHQYGARTKNDLSLRIASK